MTGSYHSTPSRRLKPAHIRFFRFLGVGAFAAIVNFCSRIWLGYFMGYSASIVLAYVLGMVTAFVLNRALVFKHAGGAISTQATWFVIINLLAVLQTLGVSILLARWLLPAAGWTWRPELVAHAVGVAFPVITSYFGHKHLSFREHTTPNHARND
jgi:putative flippase GtrA